MFFFFKQKTAYEMRISDWSSDVCSSDLGHGQDPVMVFRRHHLDGGADALPEPDEPLQRGRVGALGRRQDAEAALEQLSEAGVGAGVLGAGDRMAGDRSEEHTSELQSLMRISYAVFCLEKKNTKTAIK